MVIEPAAEQIPLLDLGTPNVMEASAVTSQSSAVVEEARLPVVDAAPVSTPNWETDWSFGDDLALPAHHPLSEALKRESHRAEPAIDDSWAEMRIAEAPQLAETQRPAEASVDVPRQQSWSDISASSYAEAPDGFLVDAQPIHGNLLEFPMELVASRKVRPRRAEGIYGLVAEGEPQLSIFEVDPASVSTQPDAVEQPAETVAWSRPEWAGMKLEATEPQGVAAEPVIEVVPAKALALQAAPMNLRILAAVVDFGLVSVVFLSVALLVAVKASVLPTLREAEMGGGIVFAAIALANLAISYTLARATPGMKYALISLRTFDGLTPTREQRCRRLGALAISMLPVGLGAVWAVFDEEHLSWHDRLSGTYLRRV